MLSRAVGPGLARARSWAWAPSCPATLDAEALPPAPRDRRALPPLRRAASTSTRGAPSSSSYFLRYRRETGSRLRLVLIGKAVLDVPDGPGDRRPRASCPTR